MKENPSENKTNDPGKKLFDAFGSIDNDLINEAEEYSAKAKESTGSEPPFKKSRIKWRKVLLSAAAIGLIIALLITSGIFKGGLTVPADPTGTSGTQTEGSKPVPVWTGVPYNEGDVELPDGIENIKVSAEGASPYSLQRDGRLIIETDSPLEAETLAKCVSITPKTDMAMTKLADNKYGFAPANGGFTPGTVYKVSIGSPDNPTASYAFQTETEVCIKSMLPEDKSTGVSVNTGIEITFTESVRGNDFSEFISITPEVKGEFELYPNGRTVVFIPDEDLDFSTNYTVEIKKGIKGASGKELEKSSRVRFTTSKEMTYSYDPGYLFMSVKSKYQDLSSIFDGSSTIRLSLDTNGYALADYNVEIKTQVYRFKDISAAEEAVIKKIHNFSDNSFPEDGLEFFGDFTKEYSILSTPTINIDGPFKKGVYLVKLYCEAVTQKGKTLTAEEYMLFQVSDMRAYTFSSDGKTLFWLNETGKGESSGTTVSGKAFIYDPSDEDEEKISVDLSGKTDGDGLFVFESKNTNCAVIKAEKGDDALLSLFITEKTDTEQRYLSTVYTDREVYFSNDKVNFRGFLAPSYDSVSLPKELYLETSVSSSRQKLVISSDGMFEGSYLIDGLAQGGLYLKFVNEDDKIVASKYISITEEAKPQISAELSFDKLFYRYGETIGVDLFATFFDGTPAEGYEFTLSCSPFGDELERTHGSSPYVTDENGKIHIEIKTGFANASSTNPIYVYVYAELTGEETQRLYISKSVLYFHSDYIYEASRPRGCVKLTLNFRDFSKLKTQDDFSYLVYPQNTVGAPASGTVKYTLKKETPVLEIQTGYDYETKEKYTSRVYDYVTSTVKTGTASFVNGVIELPVYEPKVIEDLEYRNTEQYWYEFEFKDRGNTYRNTVYATKNEYDDLVGKNGEYTGSSSSNTGTVKPQPYEVETISYGLNVDKMSAVAGDTVKAFTRQSDGDKGKALYVLFADGINSYKLGDGFEFTFDSTMVPSANLYSVLFIKESGQYKAYSKTITYDFEKAAKLEPTVTTDKEKYLPGETATLKIKADGAKGGAALISIVDEACFALGDQKEDTASSLFKTIVNYYNRYYYYDYDYYYSPYGRQSSRKPFTVNKIINIFTLNISYDGVYSYDGAYLERSSAAFESDDGIVISKGYNRNVETNAESGYYIRKYFADNPEFKTVILDENGEGILSFTVPDNLTTWRATVSVIAGADGELKDIKAGSTTSEVLCTQPYFISINACDKYVSGDDAAFGVRSYGNGASGTVSYSATLTDENGSVIGTQSAECEPLVQAQFNFGKLAVGHYVLTVKGACGEYKDAMEKGFDVTAGSAVNTVTTDISISEIASLKPALYPVQLMFYDSDAMKGYFGCYYGRTLNRADSIAARYAMVKKNGKINGTDYSEEAEELAKQFEQYKDVSTGYIKLLTYGSTDVELTSLIMTLAPDLFTAAEKQRMIEGYSSEIASKSALDDQTLCAMLLGLASAGEPVLDQLYEVSAGADDYSVEAKLYLAAAFASIGDYDASKTILEALIKEYGVYDKEYDTLYFKADNTDDKIRQSSLAMFSAAMISKERAVSLLNFLEGTYSKTESWDLAKAMYVKFFAPNGEYKEKKATLNISGTDVDVTVKGYRRAYVTLSKSDLESFKIVNADEGIKVQATYTAAIEVSEEVTNESDRIKIEKSITHFKGDIYEVTLRISGTSTRKCEYFTISDTIPSGARYFNSIETGYEEKRTSSLITWGGIYNTTTQKMRGSVSINNRKAPNNSMDCEKYSFETSVSYYIRGALDGNFIVESAIVRNSESNYYAKSDRMSLTISNRREWKLQELDIA